MHKRVSDLQIDSPCGICAGDETPLSYMMVHF